MPKPNQAMLDATHRIVADAPPGATPTAIWRRLQEAGYVVPRASSVARYLEQLRRMGILTEDGRVLLPPLYPAYLLADLPEPGRPELQRALAEHTGRLRRLATEAQPRGKGASQLELFLAASPQVALTDGQPGTLVATRTTVAQLEWLRQRCVDLGAKSVQSFLVLRLESPAA
ncbi:MAG: hypothetical protein ACRDF9_05605 [Candidatus Limnocylindria bacterium]